MLPRSLLDNFELVDLELIQQLVELQRIYAWLHPPIVMLFAEGASRWGLVGLGPACSAPRLLRAVAGLLQRPQGHGHLVSLQVDHAIFDGAAGTSGRLELLEQSL